MLIYCFIVRILLWIGFNMAGTSTVNLCCFVLQIVQETYVLCRLKTKKGSDFPLQTNLNDVLPKLLSNQETWPMNMDVDDSSTGTGLHLSGPLNIMTSGANRSHFANDMIPEVRLSINLPFSPHIHCLSCEHETNVFFFFFLPSSLRSMLCQTDLPLMILLLIWMNMLKRN